MIYRGIDTIWTFYQFSAVKIKSETVVGLPKREKKNADGSCDKSRKALEGGFMTLCALTSPQPPLLLLPPN